MKLRLTTNDLLNVGVGSTRLNFTILSSHRREYNASLKHKCASSLANGHSGNVWLSSSGKQMSINFFLGAHLLLRLGLHAAEGLP